MTVAPPNAGHFHTTRWTQVLAARGSSPEAKRALRELCAAYYAPVELFVRRYRGGDEAGDLTHEFFAKLLEGHSLSHLDRTRGRFRSYLLGAVKHFLADFADCQQAARRGGGQPPQSLDQRSDRPEAGDVPRADVADPRGFPPDAFFDRQWAVAVVEQAIETLRQESEAAGDAARFDVLKRWLVAPAGPDTAVEAARSLNLTADAFKMAVHRLRQRFRAAVKARLADTVDDPAEIADELNYLIQALTVPIPDSVQGPEA